MMNIIFDEKKEKIIAEFTISDLFYNPSLSSLSLAAMTVYVSKMIRYLRNVNCLCSEITQTIEKEVK